LTDELVQLCGTVPSAPAGVPTTTRVQNDITIAWQTSAANGSPISYYKVFVRKPDYNYELETTACDSSVTANVAALSCTVSLDTLTAAPFNLEQENSVWVKVIAGNVFGDSQLSLTGNGATVYLIPAAPANFKNDLADQS
jgi:hypothetical protein